MNQPLVTQDRKSTKPFKLKTEFEPAGDQETAIASLTDGVLTNQKHQTLLGVTGSGKTFTMANVIEKTQRPTLILAHNKTLVAQLYQEFKAFFPDNAVEYFVSYYDYYQPEAYVPSTDTYIEKDSQVNDTIDRMRHRATRSILSRDDVIIVASVSCIYGIGSTESYQDMTAYAEVGRPLARDSFIRQLIESQYERNDVAFSRSTFRVRGDVIEVFPPHEEDVAIRISFFGDEVESITRVDPLRGITLSELSHCTIWPASHYATTKERMRRAIGTIQSELLDTLQNLKRDNRLLEAQRLEQRTNYDLEMLETVGSCKGIENYSRHLTGRLAGEPPPTLIDYFPKDFLLFVDESHQTIPQIGAMYKGDQVRKSTLVSHGFRLPSAMDNRPLRFNEFEDLVNQSVFVSATPKDYEINKSQGVIVEQVVRPTGLLDPEVEVRPVSSQVDDIIAESNKRIKVGERVLITTLTKRMSEDLTDYLMDVGIKAKYLHSDIKTIERTEILNGLRAGDFEVLVGINLLREGLDLPEVSLVGILDADKEGFLRSETGLIQTIGRAARNLHGKAILYGDRITGSMKGAIDETNRRRKVQQAHNEKHGITPTSIKKKLMDIEKDFLQDDKSLGKEKNRIKLPKITLEDPVRLEKAILNVKNEMLGAAKKLQFEKAADLRDQLHELEHRLLALQT